MKLPPPIAALVQAADARPEDVQRQMAAAYALDREGHEAQALDYYERAHALGVPEKYRVGFLLGYGSTLKNNRRLEDSQQVLEEALLIAPKHEGLPVFLALTLHAQGRSAEALATLIELLLSLGDRAPGVAQYRAALSEYAALLRDEPSR